MMRNLERLIALAAILTAGPSFAQKFPPGITPNVIRSERIAPGEQSGSQRWAALGSDGQLYIDWPLVERLAESSISQADSETARMLLAVRDGRWRNMPK